jgi:hypothetical protein
MLPRHRLAVKAGGFTLNPRPGQPSVFHDQHPRLVGVVVPLPDHSQHPKVAFGMSSLFAKIAPC